MYSEPPVIRRIPMLAAALVDISFYKSTLVYSSPAATIRLHTALRCFILIHSRGGVYDEISYTNLLWCSRSIGIAVWYCCAEPAGYYP
jgi:hypothetical protein